MLNSKIPNTRRRRSIRLKGYDDSRAGLYFITICTHNRLPLFGDIDNERMNLNECGRIAMGEWQRTSEIRVNVNLDEFVIMPNHVHGIIKICMGTMHRAHTPFYVLPIRTD